MPAGVKARPRSGNPPGSTVCSGVLRDAFGDEPPVRTAARALSALAAAVVALAPWGCGGRPAPARSLVLITIDTLRADRLGCYGDPDGLTPNLDRLAGEGVLFEDASTAVPITLPSHATLLTGRYPTATGVLDNGTYALPDDDVTLAESLRDAGWDTAAVIAAFPLKRRFGLDQGFRIYDDAIEPPPGRPQPRMRVNFVERDARAVTDRALEVWRALDAGRRFLWVHYFDPHLPYAAPPPFAGRHASPYDDEVAFADAEAGRLLEAIRADDPAAVVVVVADHGEALGDHGELNHGLFLYQSTVHVPMIVRAPGRLPAGRRVTAPVSLADVAPTLWALLGVPAPADVDGADLLPLVGGGPPPERPVYAETYLPRLEYRFSELKMLRRGPIKYIDAPRPELYDLVGDPREADDLSARRSADAAAMADRLRGFLAEAAPDAGARARTALDPETEAKLRSLGYLAAGSAPSGSEERGRDPKDMVDYFRRHGEANVAFMENRFDDGIAILRDLASRAPENFMIHHHIGSALLASGRYAEAEAEFRAVLARAPEFSTDYRLLATAQERQGKLEEAAASYRAEAALVPGSGRPYELLGRMMEAWGRFDAAVAAYREAVAREPSEAEFSRRLLEFRLSRGEAGLAVGELSALVERHSDAPELRIALAGAERRAGRPDDALETLSAALELEPYRADALLAVAAIQLENGRADLAAAAYRRVLALDPGNAEAREGLVRAGTPR